MSLLPQGTSLLQDKGRWFFRTSSGKFFEVNPHYLPSIHQEGDFFDALLRADPALRQQHMEAFHLLENSSAPDTPPSAELDIRGEGLLAQGIRDYQALYPEAFPEGFPATLAVSDYPAPPEWLNLDKEMAEQSERWWIRISVQGGMCQIEPLARGGTGINHQMTRARILAASTAPHLDAQYPVLSGESRLKEQQVPYLVGVIISILHQRISEYGDIGVLTRIDLRTLRRDEHPILPIPPCEGYPAPYQHHQRAHG